MGIMLFEPAFFAPTGYDPELHLQGGVLVRGWVVGGNYWRLSSQSGAVKAL